jgi:hypothetical protein
VLAVRYLEPRGVVKVVVRRGVRIEDECFHQVERANECVLSEARLRLGCMGVVQAILESREC